MEIINIAQGVMVILGAYLSYTLQVHAGIDPFVGLFLTMPVMFVVGVGDRVGLHQAARPRNRTALSILVTFAVAIVIEGILTQFYSRDLRSVDAWYVDQSLHVFGFYLPYIYVFGFALAVVAARRAVPLPVPDADRVTASGRRCRTGTGAELIGIDIDRVSAITFGIGAAVTAAGGMVFGATNSFNPNSGYDLISRLLVIVVLGGLGSIGGALVAAIVALVIEDVTAVRLVAGVGQHDVLRRARRGAAGAAERAVRAGRRRVRSETLIRGGRGHEPGADRRTCGRPPGRRRRCRRPGGWVVVAALLAASALPVRVQQSGDHVSRDLHAALRRRASAWNMFSGYTGYMALGNAVFYGSGAYFMANLTTHLDLRGGVGRLRARAPRGHRSTGLVAIPVGWLALRTRRHTFVVITIAIFFIFQLLAYNLRSITDGSAGM